LSHLNFIAIIVRQNTRSKHFHDVAEMSYKTKTGEEVTGETYEFVFYPSPSLTSVVRTA